jgi:peptide/nickel transport system substrate-binding protein
MKAAKLLWYLVVFFSVNACRPAPKQEVVIIRAPADPESLNPINYGTANALQIINLIYQSLLAIDLQDNQLKPLLVEQLPQVTQQKHGASFTYRLRDEAFWDPKHPITAHDVAFTLKVIKAPLVNNEKLRTSLEFIRDIKIDPVDSRKFTIICEGYVPEMTWVTGDFAILPAHLVDPKHYLDKFSVAELSSNYDSLSKHAAIKSFADWFNSARFTQNKDFLQGSGAYELVDWKTGQEVKLRKKQFWWADRLSTQLLYITARPTTVNFQVIPENNTAVLALKSARLDVYQGLPPTDFLQLRRNQQFQQKYTLFSPPTYDFTYIGINGRNEKFADKRTRQALACLLDVPKMIQVTQRGFAIQTIGPVNPANKLYYNNHIQPYTFNLTRAAALLQAAGWQKVNNQWQKEINGELTPLTILLNYKAGNSEFENIAFIFQQAAAKINIPVTIQPIEGVLLSNNLKARQFEVTIRYGSGNPFVFNYKPILHTQSADEGGNNFSGFGNPESDNLIEAINEEKDTGRKAHLLRRFQEILHEESNLIYLYFNTDRLAVHKRFTNLKISGIKPGYDVSAFTLKSE